MALGDLSLFTWKTKAQQEKEQDEYEKWAFPYGKAQRDKLVKLMLEVFPKESETTTLIPFLTCKELYNKLCKTPDLHDYAIKKLLDMKNYKHLIRKQDMPVYVALVAADARIGESLEYPSAEEIRAKAKSFETAKK
jgi:hypothetical protein